MPRIVPELKRGIRENIFIAAAGIVNGTTKEDEADFKAWFCMDKKTYMRILALMRRSLEPTVTPEEKAAVFENGTEKEKEMVAARAKIQEIIRTSRDKEKDSWTIERCLQLILMYYSGRCLRENLHDYGIMRSKVLLSNVVVVLHSIVLLNWPIFIRKNKIAVATRENAMFKMHGLTNGIYWFDVKNVFVSSQSNLLRVMGKMRSLKIGLFVDSCLTIDDYCIGLGGLSDEAIFKQTEIGNALINRREKEVLGWPDKFTWRHDEGKPPLALEEVGGYVVTDRKIQGCLHNVLRPFLPKFIAKTGCKETESLPKMVNDRFKIGYNPAERLFGQFTNKYSWLSSTWREKDIGFVYKSLEILLHLWNIFKDEEESYFQHKLNPMQKKSPDSALFLKHYISNPRTRFSVYPSPPTQLGHLPRILTQLWTYFEPRAKSLQNNRITFDCPYKMYPIVYKCKKHDDCITSGPTYKQIIADSRVEKPDTK